MAYVWRAYCTELALVLLINYTHYSSASVMKWTCSDLKYIENRLEAGLVQYTVQVQYIRSFGAFWHDISV